MVPIFVLGFAGMSALRTWGDMDARPFGVLDPAEWKAIVGYIMSAAEYCLAVAMAAVGLGTSIAGLRQIGLKPLALGLFAALLVGAASAILITLLY